MNKQLVKDALGWGIGLWLFGYVLGIILFMIVPQSYLSWILMPIGSAFTLWVLYKKIKKSSMKYYLWLSIVWTIVAVVFDYLFLVSAFKTTGYYSFHIYLYYFLTFAFPLFVGWHKNLSSK